MLTLEQTLEQQKDLYKLCCDRPLYTKEIFGGNAFYGNDKIVKLYAELPLDYPLKLNIEHGVSICDSDADKVWNAEINSILPVLTYKREENKRLYEQALIKYKKEKKLIPIASPILYLSSLINQEKRQKREGTIFFPAHSTHTITAETNWQELALNLKKLDLKYHPITVCIYWKDYLLGRHIPFQEQGFKVVSAGHMFDPDFLFRFYHLCSQYHYSASNELGSNLFYSVSAGCSYFYWEGGEYNYKTNNPQEQKYCNLTQDEENKGNELKDIFRQSEHDLSQEKLDLVNYYLGKQYFLTPKKLQKQILEAEMIFCSLSKKYDNLTTTMNNNQKIKSSSNFTQNTNNILLNFLEKINSNQTINDLDISSLNLIGINYAKAVLLAKQGQIPQAINHLDLLLAHSPSHRKGNHLKQELKKNLNEDQIIDQNSLLDRIEQLLTSNQTAEAFKILNQTKAEKQAILNLDYLRAKCFLQIRQPASAIQSLYEELRYFPDNHQAKLLLEQLLKQYPQFVARKINDAEFQELYQAIQPYTMLSEARLYSLFTLVKKICIEDIAGNFVECGVAGGGSTGLISALVKRYSKQPRTVYAFDSFEGMPTPTEEDKSSGIPAELTGWGTGTCSAPEDSVTEICQKLGSFDVVTLVKGYFEDTLPKMRDQLGVIAFLHMDGDWYSSTQAIINNLYSYVSPNGYIQIDDYGFWEGCRQAVTEFQEDNNLKFNLNVIDSTGVWFAKSEVTPLNPTLSPQQPTSKLKWLNLGCGRCFHPDWTNVDFNRTGEGVIPHNLLKGIPFANNSFEVVYHSHLLEHLPKNEALPFLTECHRVLQPNGIIRVVIPDLEQIARLYLQSLENALNGSETDAHNYNWLMLEMYDQVVRNESGGDMKRYLAQNPLPNPEFIVGRFGVEGEMLIKAFQGRNFPSKSLAELNPTQIGQFRQGGEVHQWMYDRYSLKVLLEKVGFVDVKVCQANESRINGFNNYHLDVMADGKVRKSDSLFMEGIKP